MSNPRSAAANMRRRSGADDLYAIVYVSTAARPVSLNDLMPLLDAARQRNQQEGITGVLLYADQRFMQCLEGPAAGLSRVYDIIKAHPLHYGLIDLVREPIAVREFADWAMAFQMAGAFGRSSPAAQDAFLARHLDSLPRRSSRACDLLSRFWNEGGDSVRSALRRHKLERSQHRAWRDLDTGTGD